MSHHHHDHDPHSHAHAHTHTHDHHHDHGHDHHHAHPHEHVHTHAHDTHDHAGDHAHTHTDHGGHTHASVENRSSSTLTFPEKLEKLLSHWIGHNDHHVADYRQWADDATQNGQTGVAESLVAAAELTSAVTEKFRQALSRIKKNG